MTTKTKIIGWTIILLVLIGGTWLFNGGRLYDMLAFLSYLLLVFVVVGTWIALRISSRLATHKSWLLIKQAFATNPILKIVGFLGTAFLVLVPFGLWVFVGYPLVAGNLINTYGVTAQADITGVQLMHCQRGGRGCSEEPVATPDQADQAIMTLHYAGTTTDVKINVPSPEFDDVYGDSKVGAPVDVKYLPWLPGMVQPVSALTGWQAY